MKLASDIVKPQLTSSAFSQASVIVLSGISNNSDGKF